MRLDQYLKQCRLMKRRSEAKRACDNGIITIDQVQAKASREVRPGNVIAIAFVDRYLDVKVLDIPKGNVSKAAAKDFYQVERDEERELLKL